MQQQPPQQQPRQYRNNGNPYNDNQYNYPNPDSLQNRPGTNNSPTSYSGAETASAGNGDKEWVKPHWKHTYDGWVWIEGYWRPKQYN